MSAPFYAPPISYFSLNTKGRDYVIGDIHGRYDLVYEALKRVNFNTDNDRLFCVGDLIDRGELSFHVLEFLQWPFVHAIRGNHEDILLDLYKDDEPPTEERIAYIGAGVGLSWWLDVAPERRQLILAALRKLPLVAEIETLRGQVGLIHADIDEDISWSEFKSEVNKGNNHVIQEALWGRTRLGNNIVKQVEGIGRIFVGHTVQSNVKKLANVIGIDTGAVFNQYLTIASLPVATEIIQNAPYPKGDIHVLNCLTENRTPFSVTPR